MIESARERRAFLANLDKLRLLVAEDIICNGLNTIGATSNIFGATAAGELCDQYCLKIFFYWIATEGCLPLCTTAIQLSLPLGRKEVPTPAVPAIWQPFTDRYPFYTYFDSSTEQGFLARAFLFMNQHLEPEVETAGYLYLRSLTTPMCINTDGKPYLANASERHCGEFYTSAAVVDYCINQSSWRKTTAELLDPACGSGNFLLGAVRTSADPFAAAQRIYGWDIDGKAVAIARAAVYLSALSQRQRNRCSIDQTLTESLARTLANNIVIKNAIAGSNDTRRFDLVITNPPYISFGARNQPQLPASQDSYLRRMFPASSQYKIRLHSIFQELCVRLAKPNGEAVLLVPDAFLTGAYYEHLRRVIIDEATIERLTELPESTFADATAGRWCIAHYRKTEKRAALSHKVTLSRLGVNNQVQSFLLPQADLICKDKHRFRLLFDRRDLDIWRQMDGLALVKERFRGHTGLRARQGQKSIIAESQRASSWHRGIASGAEIKPHQLSWRGNWLHIDPKLLFAGGFDDGIISNPKVLVRQTGDRLIGALDADGLYHLNNVHAFAPIDKSSLRECALFCALINSRLWLYLYQLKSGERRRALAQIDIEMVESMPLAKPQAVLESQIANLALEGMNTPDPDLTMVAAGETPRLRMPDVMVAAGESPRLRMPDVMVAAGESPLLRMPDVMVAAGESPLLRMPEPAILRAIDRLIYDLYELGQKQVSYIEAVTRDEDLSASLPSSKQACNLLQSCTEGLPKAVHR